jgi:hypothetical protein
MYNYVDGTIFGYSGGNNIKDMMWNGWLCQSGLAAFTGFVDTGICA